MIFANVLTIIRVLLAPAVAYLILTDKPYPAAAVYAVAAITDAVDGYLSRRRGHSYFGEIFDASADFFLIYIAIAALAIKKAFTPLPAIIIIMSAILLVLMIGIISIKAKKLRMPHRDSMRCAVVLIHLAVLAYILNLWYARIIVYAAAAGGVYVLADYIKNLKKYQKR